MTIQQALQLCANEFIKTGLPNPRLDAEVLLGFATEKSREFIYTYPDNQLTKKQQAALNKIIVQRTKGAPVAYITGHKEFFGLDFFVNKNVLIPRPETELLVEETLKLAQELTANHMIRLADIGAGSGCVIISLAKNVLSRAKTRGKLRFYASDVSPAAIRVAKRNARRHQVSSKIKFYTGNLLEPFHQKKLDIIVANLPYLDDKPEKLFHSSLSQSLKYEPALALRAGASGLAIYQEFFQQIKQLDSLPKQILIEISPEQANRIKKMVKKLFPDAMIIVIKDLAGRNRVVKTTL